MKHPPIQVTRRVLGHTLEAAAFVGRDGTVRVSRIIQKHTKDDLELLCMEPDARNRMCVRLDGRLFCVTGLFPQFRKNAFRDGEWMA